MSRPATPPAAAGKPRKSPLRLAEVQQPSFPGSTSRGGRLSPQQLRAMMITEFEQWLRSRTNQEKRPFNEETVVAYAKAARALDAWMTKQKVDGDFTACDTATLNSFFRDYNGTHSRGGTNTKQRNLRHLVARDPCGPVAGVKEPGDHARGQLRLGGEGGLLAETGSAAAVGVGGPGARNIQFPVHSGVPTPACVNQVYSDLGVLDSARGAGVLALDGNRAGALLHVPGLVDHQHRLVVVQVLHHVTAHVVADGVGVPLGPPQQVLHAVRGHLSGPFGDGPAVLARQVRQEPEYQPPDPASGFDPREAARDPAHQVLECPLPAGRVYAVTCGHRMIFSLHTPMINGGRICVRSRPSRQDEVRRPERPDMNPCHGPLAEAALSRQARATSR
jgi:hypothetical protein